MENAIAAGAVAVLLIDTPQTVHQPETNRTFKWFVAPRAVWCLHVPAPVAMVNWYDGQAIKSAIRYSETVLATFHDARQQRWVWGGSEKRAACKWEEGGARQVGTNKPVYQPLRCVGKTAL